MAFEKALGRTREVFREAEVAGFNLNLLDIGGGFQAPGFEKMASVIRHFITREFPSDVQVIAEPGRLYAQSVFTLAAKVIARRQGQHSSQPDALYQSDGVYGNFMNIIREQEVIHPPALLPMVGSGHARAKAESKYDIWGPTCCGLDCVVREATFDSEVHIGDWLAYGDMGGKVSMSASGQSDLLADFPGC